ncbi:uncharacterized protein VTP21DRAFT_8112 [Calcarisporiella thermophila]|uniref:uncharacterized protein n=1 Tax=Calcarisporiella thermophila TaxID=911321 RepID=UPI0037425D03
MIGHRKPYAPANILTTNEQQDIWDYSLPREDLNYDPPSMNAAMLSHMGASVASQAIAARQRESYKAANILASAPSQREGRNLVFKEKTSLDTQNHQAGYNIQFWKQPDLNHLSPPRSLPANQASAAAISEEIIALLEKWVIEEVPMNTPGVVSNIFVIEKHSGKLRPVLDLRRLNLSVKKAHFKMETLHLILPLIQRHDWMTSIDLKDVFFHIPNFHLSPTSRPYRMSEDGNKSDRLLGRPTGRIFDEGKGQGAHPNTCQYPGKIWLPSELGKDRLHPNAGDRCNSSETVNDSDSYSLWARAQGSLPEW